MINAFKDKQNHTVSQMILVKFKGIVSPDWKDLQMVSLDKFEV
jgi:hypothetical protein